MKVLLLYFSGTGNTAYIADRIRDSLIGYGHEARTWRYRQDKERDFDLAECDLIGLGYPIHAFNAPEVFNSFVKSLPKGDKPYFVFKVSGEPFRLNDASSFIIVKNMKRKGYRLVGEKHFLMPYNIMFRYKDALAKQMALLAPLLGDAYVKSLLLGEAPRIKHSLSKRLVSFIFRIEYLAPRLNAPFIRVRKEKCVDCHKCVDNCPTKAIEKWENGKYRFRASSCSMCMNCAYSCPKDAIVFGFMNPWKVNGPFDYEGILNDPAIPATYVDEGRKGYFHLFLRYFRREGEFVNLYQGQSLDSK